MLFNKESGKTIEQGDPLTVLAALFVMLGEKDLATLRLRRARQLRWSRRNNPQRISEDTLPVFSSSPPRFLKTLKMLTTEPFFTTLLKVNIRLPRIPFINLKMSHRFDRA